MADSDGHHPAAGEGEEEAVQLAAIVGGSVAAGLALVILCVLLFCCNRRRCCKKQEVTPVTSPSPPAPKFSPQWASRGATLPASLSLHLPRSLSALSLPEIATSNAQFGGRDVRNLRFTSFLAQPTSGWRSVSPEVPIPYETIPLPPPPSCDMTSPQMFGDGDATLPYHGDAQAPVPEDSAVYETISIPRSPVVVTPGRDAVVLPVPEDDDYASLPLPFPSPPPTPDLQELQLQETQPDALDVSGYATPDLHAQEHQSEVRNAQPPSLLENRDYSPGEASHAHMRLHKGLTASSAAFENTAQSLAFGVNLSTQNRERHITSRQEPMQGLDSQQKLVADNPTASLAQGDNTGTYICSNGMSENHSYIAQNSMEEARAKGAQRAESLYRGRGVSAEHRQGRRRWQSESDTPDTSRADPGHQPSQNKLGSNLKIPSDFLRETGVSVVFCRTGQALPREPEGQQQGLTHEAEVQRLTDRLHSESRDGPMVKEEGVVVVTCSGDNPGSGKTQLSADALHKEVTSMATGKGDIVQNAKSNQQPFKEKNLSITSSLPHNIQMPSSVQDNNEYDHLRRKINSSGWNRKSGTDLSQKSPPASVPGSQASEHKENFVYIERSPCSQIPMKSSDKEIGSEDFVILPRSPVHCAHGKQGDSGIAEDYVDFVSVPKSPCTRVPNNASKENKTPSTTKQNNPKGRDERERSPRQGSRDQGKEEEETVDYVCLPRSPSSRAPYSPVRRQQAGRGESDYDHLQKRPGSRVSVLCHHYAQLQPQGSSRPGPGPLAPRPPGNKPRGVSSPAETSVRPQQGGPGSTPAADSASRGVKSPPRPPVKPSEGGSSSPRSSGKRGRDVNSPPQSPTSSSQGVCASPRSTEISSQGGGTSSHSPECPKPSVSSSPGTVQKSKGGGNVSPRPSGNMDHVGSWSPPSSVNSTQGRNTSPRLEQRSKTCAKQTLQPTERRTPGGEKSPKSSENHKQSAQMSPRTAQKSRGTANVPSPSSTTAAPSAVASPSSRQKFERSGSVSPRSSESGVERVSTPFRSTRSRDGPPSRSPGKQRSSGRRKVPYEECVVRL